MPSRFRIRRRVDRILILHGRAAAVAGAMPALAMAAIDSVAGGPWLTAGWAAALAAAASWWAFIAWRGWRMTRAWALRRDRLYDRGGKLGLPSEYAATRSATAARRLSRCRRFD